MHFSRSFLLLHFFALSCILLTTSADPAIIPRPPKNGNGGEKSGSFGDDDFGNDCPGTLTIPASRLDSSETVPADPPKTTARDPKLLDGGGGGGGATTSLNGVPTNTGGGGAATSTGWPTSIMVTSGGVVEKGLGAWEVMGVGIMVTFGVL